MTTYATSEAFRAALEQRLQNRARSASVSVTRLRRRVAFERIVARLDRAEPGAWVVKGGMALEVRLQDDARLTRDIDLGLRGAVLDADELHDRLLRALVPDLDGDHFELQVERPVCLEVDSAGTESWRTKVDLLVGGRRWDRMSLDISPRPHELMSTDRVELPRSLAFIDVPVTTAEIVDVHRHAAEKMHAMARTYASGESTRVRDLLDIVLMREADLLDPAALRTAVEDVWRERNDTAPPRDLPPLPASWPDRYAQMTTREGVTEMPFDGAVALVHRLWAEMDLAEGE